MATKKTTTRKSTTSKKSPAKSPRKSTKKTTARKRPQKAQKQETTQVEAQAPASNSEPVQGAQRYIRNLRGVPAAVRLERHDKKRRIELKPRGQRGDLSPIQEDDLHDPIFLNNLGLLYEIITAAEAAEVVNKQTTNQQAHHPALATLRNELGNEYEEGAITVEEIDSEQGTVVAELEDGNVVVDRRGIKRVRGEAPGTPAEVAGAEPGHQPANEEARLLSDDRRARAKDAVTPTDILGGRTQVLEPVQKT